MDTAKLQGWYTSLRDMYTRLCSTPSGAQAKELTDREQWVTNNFRFLKQSIKHKRKQAPVTSVKEALERAGGNLAAAEALAADARLDLTGIDDIPLDTTPTDKNPKKKTAAQASSDDAIMAKMQEQLAVTAQQLDRKSVV